MVDIIKNIAVDEHYTITSEVVSTGSEEDKLLKGAVLGRVTKGDIRVITRTVEVPKVIQGKIVYVSRYVREKERNLKSMESLTSSRDLVDAYVAKNIPIKLGDRIRVFDSVLVKGNVALAVYDTPGERGMKKKKLGVQNATVFRNAQQISTDRMIQRQKKELRSDLKASVMKVESLGNLHNEYQIKFQTANTELTKAKATISALGRNLTLKTNKVKAMKGDMQRNYVTKAYHQKTLGRLQATLQSYAARATGQQVYQPNIQTGGDVGEVTRQQRQRQKSAVLDMENQRKSLLGEQFNRMGMKARRA
jgi:hypothetical protein